MRKHITNLNPNEGGLRPEPATEYECGRMRRFREAGTSPGNPKWYRPQRVQLFEFTPGLPAVVPAWTRKTAMSPQ